MAALPGDIGPAKREAIIVSVSDTAIQTRFPNARDQAQSPAEGFFDAEADAQTALTARAAIIGVFRRRFTVEVADLIQPDLSAGLPAYRLTDAEQGIDAVCIAARIEVDLENEQTNVELMG